MPGGLASGNVAGPQPGPCSGELGLQDAGAGGRGAARGTQTTSRSPRPPALSAPGTSGSLYLGTLSLQPNKLLAQDEPHLEADRPHSGR